MVKKISTPPYYSLIKKGKTLLLLKDTYRDLLLKQGIEDLDSFLKTNLHTATYQEGRTRHPSIPLSDGRRMVVRQYLHGGLLRALTGDIFLLGRRSIDELNLTEEIRSCGIPTAEPIGTIHQLTSFPPFYRACLLTIEVPGALNLIQYLEKGDTRLGRQELSQKRRLIRATGLLLRQFHQFGFFHRDLQLKNILVSEGRILIIDFDRSYRKLPLPLRERMKNLLRLNRSVEKWKQFGLNITRTDRWRFFLAYAGEDGEIRDAMRKVLRNYRLRYFLYRLSWALQKKLETS